MAITKEFLELFKEFVTAYKTNGTPSRVAWNNDQDYKIITQSLEELYEIISSQKDYFHDISIIDHLNTPINLAAQANPYLSKSWNGFLTKYNNKTGAFVCIGATQTDGNIPINTHINIGAQGKVSEKLVNDLQKALASTLKTLGLIALAHANETEDLQIQIQELRRENLLLSQTNSQLQQQIQDQTYLKSLVSQIEAAKTQAASFNNLFSTLQDALSTKQVDTGIKESSVASNETASNSSPKAQKVQAISPISSPRVTVSSDTLKPQEAQNSSPGLNIEASPPTPPIRSASTPTTSFPIPPARPAPALLVKSIPAQSAESAPISPTESTPPPPPPPTITATITATKTRVSSKFFPGQSGDLQKDIELIRANLKKEEGDDEKKKTTQHRK